MPSLPLVSSCATHLKSSSRHCEEPATIAKKIGVRPTASGLSASDMSSLRCSRSSSFSSLPAKMWAAVSPYAPGHAGGATSARAAHAGAACQCHSASRGAAAARRSRQGVAGAGALCSAQRQCCTLQLAGSRSLTQPSATHHLGGIEHVCNAGLQHGSACMWLCAALCSCTRPR